MNIPGDSMYDPSNSPPPQPPADETHELLLGELTAALAAEASSPLDTLPASASARAMHVGEAMVRAQHASGGVTPVGGSVSATEDGATAAQHAKWRVRTVVAWSGWLAAAALLAFAVRAPRTDGAPLSEIPTAAMLRDSLVLADRSSMRLAFTAGDDVTAIGAEGDVVWSARTQRGVMRIVGLAPNDRAKWQYQLWIFDKQRDQRFPVDGGVFDIPSGSREVFVPIDARVPVDNATLFAVTIEPAGGVVVSARERVVLTAGF